MIHPGRHGFDSVLLFDSTQSQKGLTPTQLVTYNGFQELIQINSWFEMVFWNLNQNDSRLKWLSRISIQIASRLGKLSRVLIQINLWHKKLSRILIQIDSRIKKTGILIGIISWLNYIIMIEPIPHWILLGMIFLGLPVCPIRFGLVWPLWAFDSNVFPRNWLDSTHDSNSISESWIDSTLDSSGFPGNWHRISSRLMRIPKYWFRSTHDSGSTYPGP